MIETLPLEQAADAYARIMQGKARFRMVLVTKDGVAQEASVNGRTALSQNKGESEDALRELVPS